VGLANYYFTFEFTSSFDKNEGGDEIGSKIFCQENTSTIKAISTPLSVEESGLKENRGGKST
jgi:hypothetical protein